MPSGLVNLSATPIAGDLLFFDGTGWKALPKGNDGQVLTMVSGLPAWKDVSTGNEILKLHDPVLEIVFKDRPGNHNMGIASDGKYLYTCNGGNYTVGRINKYTLTGDSITSYPIAIDMRSIMYNTADGKLYVSGFESKHLNGIFIRLPACKTEHLTKLFPTCMIITRAAWP